MAESTRIYFRAVDGMDQQLSARSRTGDPGEPLGPVAQEQLGRWFRFLAVQLSTVRLTREQAGCLCDILTGMLFDEPWARNPGLMIAAGITDSDPEYGPKWDVDLHALAETARGWNPGQGFAVLDAVERFWRHPGLHATGPDALGAVLAEVGLTRTHPASSPLRP